MDKGLPGALSGDLMIGTDKARLSVYGRAYPVGTLLSDSEGA